LYVCNCNGIREREVRQAIESGACKPRDVFEAHGARPQCAKCVCDMRRMIQDQLEALSLAAE
jgi:bacterioferritin-associated ferredoxin